MATQTMPRFDLEVEPAGAERGSPPQDASAPDTAVRRDGRALRDEAWSAPPEAWHVLAEVDGRGGIRFTASALEIPAGAHPSARTRSHQRRST